MSDENRYRNTPRNVFDKHVDRMELKRLRDREDHRNDLKAIFSRLKNLENQHALLEEHVASHCALTGPPPFVDGNDRLKDKQLEKSG